MSFSVYDSKTKLFDEMNERVSVWLRSARATEFTLTTDELWGVEQWLEKHPKEHLNLSPTIVEFIRLSGERVINESLALWLESGRSPTFLLSWARLWLAQRWQANVPSDKSTPYAPHFEFIDLSRDAEEARQRDAKIHDRFIARRSVATVTTVRGTVAERDLRKKEEEQRRKEREEQSRKEKEDERRKQIADEEHRRKAVLTSKLDDTNMVDALHGVAANVIQYDKDRGGNDTCRTYR